MARNDATLRIGADVSGVTKSINKLNKDLNAVKLNAIVQLGKEAIGAAKGLGGIEQRLKTVKLALNNVTGSVNAGTSAFAKLDRLSQTTQFTVDQLAEQFIKLKAAGVEPTEELFRTFADTAATTTDSLGSLVAMSDLLARTTAGGLGLEDLNRLGDKGIPVFRILKDELGLSRLELTKFGQSAEGAKEITDTLFRVLGKNNLGLAAKASKTLNTAFQNLGSATDQLVYALGVDTGLFGIMTDVINGMADLISSVFRVADATDAETKALAKLREHQKKMLNDDYKRNQLLKLRAEIQKEVNAGILEGITLEAALRQLEEIDRQLVDPDRGRRKKKEEEEGPAVTISDELEKSFNDLQQSLLSEKELEESAYIDKLFALEEYYDARGEMDSEYFRLKEGLERNHNKRLEQISQANYNTQLDKFKAFKFNEIDFESLSAKERVALTEDMGKALLEEGAKNNKAMFMMNKALKLRDAIMSTAQGVSNALALGPVGIPLAAIIAGMGAVQVATIASQQYQGRQFGGTVTGREPYLVGERGPELMVPGRTGTVVPNNKLGEGQVTNITFNVEATDAQSFDSLISQRKEMIVNMIRTAHNDAGFEARL